MAIAVRRCIFLTRDSTVTMSVVFCNYGQEGDKNEQVANKKDLDGTCDNKYDVHASLTWMEDNSLSLVSVVFFF